MANTIVKVGRPKKMTDIEIGKILAWKEIGMSNTDIADRLNTAESTVRKYLKEYHENETRL